MGTQSKLAEPTPNLNFSLCLQAVLAFMAANPSPSLLRFTDRYYELSVFCSSHAVRSGFEHSGDRHLYAFLGRLLHRLYPDRVHLYSYCGAHTSQVIRSVLACNIVLGALMVHLGLFATFPTKIGGDCFETVLGALLDSRSYKDVEDYVVRVFERLVHVCVEALAPSKRKRQPDEDAAELSSPEELPHPLTPRPSKRAHVEPLVAPTRMVEPSLALPVGPQATTIVASNIWHTTPDNVSALAAMLEFLELGEGQILPVSRTPPTSLQFMTGVPTHTTPTEGASKPLRAPLTQSSNSQTQASAQPSEGRGKENKNVTSGPCNQSSKH
ncbi:hypothetical protein FB451DRAFT_1176061 [Mycena latifolia]|nr:hypothetical protein FB451DRAFT_1176061 [Mycena latifolia]